MIDTILEARGLRKAFGGLVAVDDVSFNITAGTMHSIIGPNGAGKTTLFNLLSGRYKPTSGSVIYKGQDISKLPVFKRAQIGIGRSFQITNIFPNLTVFENARLAAQAHGHDSFRFLQRTSSFHSYEKRAAFVLEITGLSGVANQLASALPHGGKRKLELAMILAPDPEVMLLDEPTAGMASEQVPELMQVIDNIRQQGGKTIVMVEHNMSVVMSISNKITVMHHGQLLAEGTPLEISTNKTVQEVYLGELYDLPGAEGA